MSTVTGTGGRDGDGIAIRIVAGLRRGCYRSRRGGSPPSSPAARRRWPRTISRSATSRSRGARRSCCTTAGPARASPARAEAGAPWTSSATGATRSPAGSARRQCRPSSTSQGFKSVRDPCRSSCGLLPEGRAALQEPGAWRARSRGLLRHGLGLRAGHRVRRERGEGKGLRFHWSDAAGVSDGRGRGRRRGRGPRLRRRGAARAARRDRAAQVRRRARPRRGHCSVPGTGPTP